MSGERVPIVVLGAGPAGVSAAWKLAMRGIFDVTVVERNATAGGNAGSFEIDGLKVDYGSHRLHPACPPAILADLHGMLGDDLQDRPRHGRIRLRDRWLRFPLKPLDLAVRLPPSFILGVLRDSALKPWRDGAAQSDGSFAAALEHGLGRTLCHDFYFPYAQKIWGVPPSALDAEQARRRVSAGSVMKMARKVLNAVPGFRPRGAGRFFYPRHGYGQISDAYHRAALSAGAGVRFGAALKSVHVEGGRARAAVVEHQTGSSCLPAKLILSTIPLPALAEAVTPAAPSQVLESGRRLRYRSMILVYLALDADRFTEYDAHYFPGPEIAISRLSEPKNYGSSGHPGRTVLCAELPCSDRDDVWTMADAPLAALVIEALAAADLPITAGLRGTVVRRLRHAYPIYTRDYRASFDRLDAWVRGIDGLVTFGRQGLFVHDNTHHALAMAYALADCIEVDGSLDEEAWDRHRRAFEAHIVED